MSYVPVVDDYVKWRNVEGWVYYVGQEYITIEYIQILYRLKRGIKNSFIFINIFKM